MKVDNTPHSLLPTPYLWLEEELSSLIGPVKFSAQQNMRLERITHLMELINRPDNSYPTIHVGGTSGKGSTATMIATLLHTAGYNVGLHTSPHLQILNERHWLNGRLAPTSQLVKVWQQIKPAVEEVRRTSPFGAPSYFEAQFALAMTHFAQEKVDVAVVEVGLGGTLDATNVINSTVAVLTNVGLDHTEILGDTVEKIAADKAGIIKPGQIVVSGCTQPTVQAIVAERCHQEQATLWQLGREFTTTEQNGTFNWSGPHHSYTGLALNLPGRFQTLNASVALAAVHALTHQHPTFALPESAIRQALTQLNIPGRIETIQENPTVLLDGAHNPDKISASAQLIATLKNGRKIITVLGLKAGKAAADILPHILPLTDQLIVTQFSEKGLWSPIPAADLATLAHSQAPHLAVQIIPHPLEAITQALAQATPADVIWVTGSLYLVGDIRNFWHPVEKLVNDLEGSRE